MPSCAKLEGMAYPETLERAWYLMILNQHHDPLMSIMARVGLFDSEIPARFEQCSSLLDQVEDEVMDWLGAEIDTAGPEGKPLIAYNSLPTVATVVLETETGGSTGGGGTAVGLVDRRESQWRASGWQPKKAGSGLLFLAEDLPALGWRTFYMTTEGDGCLNGLDDSDDSVAAAMEDSGRDARVVQATTTRMENEHLKVELIDGIIARVVEKSTGTEVLRASAECGVNEVAIWRDEGCISVIRPMGENGIVDFLHNDAAVLVARSAQIDQRYVTLLENGPLRARLQIRFELDWGRFEQLLELETGSRLLRLTTKIEWEPSGKIAPFDGRRVRLAFATAFKDARIVCDTPFGVVPWRQVEQIRPVNSWLAAESSSCGWRCSTRARTRCRWWTMSYTPP